MNEGRIQKKSHRTVNKEKLTHTTFFAPSNWLKEAKYYKGGKSEFIRESIYHYKNKRHLFKFREFLETLAGEILILSKWKEKGHPGGLKWTEKEEEMLSYYERCFDILENSPFNEELE